MSKPVLEITELCSLSWHHNLTAVSVPLPSLAVRMETRSLFEGETTGRFPCLFPLLSME